jgi:hypothetical protein
VNLIPELLNVSRANATVKTYHLGFIRWKKWASINGISSVDILPAKPFFVAIYLSSLVQSCRTVSPVTQAFYSLQWAHNLIGQPSPTDTIYVASKIMSFLLICNNSDTLKNPAYASKHAQIVRSENKSFSL